jgi:hypothetical protein
MKILCSKVRPVLLDQNITLICVMTVEQKRMSAGFVVKVNQFNQRLCSQLLDTYPVTNSISHMEHTGTVTLGLC